MATDFIFEAEAPDTIFATTAAEVVVPRDENVVRVPVSPGEVILLPIASDAEVLAKLGDGNLALKVGDVTYILEGYVAAADRQPPVIESADGKPLDIAAILASTDPAVEVQTAAGLASDQPGDADNTGGIFDIFEIGGARSAGFAAVGAQEDSSPHAFTDPAPNRILHALTASTTTTAVTNTLPSVANFGASTNEDTKVGGQLTGTDANGDPLTFHAVGTVPGLTVNANGSWSYDPAGKFDSLAAGKQTTVTFQYQANDGIGDGNIATATVTITGVNDAPVHKTGVHLVQVGEDEKGSRIDLGLFGSTTDPDSSAFTFALVGKAPTGVTLDPNGILHLDPAGHYESLNKGQTFTADVSFTVSDGSALSSTQTFTLQVLGANETALAARDVFAASGMASAHAGAEVAFSNIASGEDAVALAPIASTVVG